MRGARAPGRRVARALLGLFIILGRLALGPSPIGALGLSRLARGIELGPMVPKGDAPLSYLKERNYIVFDDVQFSLSRLKSFFVNLLTSWAGIVEVEENLLEFFCVFFRLC